MSTVIGKILLLLTFFSCLTQYCTSFDFRDDSLSMFDGDSNTSPTLGNPYCGDSLPPSQTSSRNQLFFHFYSNYVSTGTGFKLEYIATSKNPYISRFMFTLCLQLRKKGYANWNFCYLV